MKPVFARVLVVSNLSSLARNRRYGGFCWPAAAASDLAFKIGIVKGGLDEAVRHAKRDDDAIAVDLQVIKLTCGLFNKLSRASGQTTAAFIARELWPRRWTSRHQALSP
jgi:hypothetical protein